MNYSIFDAEHHVTLWPWLFPFDLWKFMVHLDVPSWCTSLMWCDVIKVCTKFERNQASPAELFIILQIFAHVMSSCNLDLWPLDLELLRLFGCHVSKLCTEFERNLIIHSWVIDDLTHLRAILEVGHNWQSFFRVREPNFTKLGQDMEWSSQHCTVVSEFGYLVLFSNAGGSKLSDVLNDAKFWTFWPREN